jgi:hypothetical protein
MITPKENYLMMLRGEIPDYIPSFFEPSVDMLNGPELAEFSMPVYAPNGPEWSPWGVKYVGSPENNFGAIPEPGNFILKDITKWRDVIKNPSLKDVDWEGRFQKVLEGKDRTTKAIGIIGGDYFQTFMSFMGFTEGLLAMYEEPEEVYALLDYISEYSLEVTKAFLHYGKPDVFMLADDCAAARAPFFSRELYVSLIKPFHKKHADLCNEAGVLIERHDCGRSESFIDDWLDIGVRAWNPAQVMNDLPAIKKKYLGRLTLNGAWDNQGPISMPGTPDETLREALETYVDTFAPGGGFSFMAMATGNKEDERVIRKTALIRDYYDNHVRNYYKTH